MKELHRSAADRKLMGVCGGVAEWLQADVTFVRLFTAAAAVFSGGVVLAIYLAAALLLPEVQGADGGFRKESDKRHQAEKTGRPKPIARPALNDACQPLMSHLEEVELRGEIERLRARMAWCDAGGENLQSMRSSLPR